MYRKCAGKIREKWRCGLGFACRLDSALLWTGGCAHLCQRLWHCSPQCCTAFKEQIYRSGGSGCGRLRTVCHTACIRACGGSQCARPGGSPVRLEHRRLSPRQPMGTVCLRWIHGRRARGSWSCAPVQQRPFPPRCSMGNQWDSIVTFPVEGPLPKGIVPAKEGKVGIRISLAYEEMFQATCWILPRILTLGIGCKRGTEPIKIQKAVDSTLQGKYLYMESVQNVASIDKNAMKSGFWSSVKQIALSVIFSRRSS